LDLNRLTKYQRTLNTMRIPESILVTKSCLSKNIFGGCRVMHSKSND
jgi:hypothetical protein